MPKPLPPNQYLPETRWHTAYEKCLNLEILPATPQRTPSLQMCARVLGYMMLEAPLPAGRDNVSNEIVDCADAEALRRLARLYMDTFVYRLIRAAKGRTPASSNHPSRPSFDNIKETFKYLLEDAPRDHRTVTQLALIRDNFRCIVTGIHDKACCLKMPELNRMINAQQLPVTGTQAAHIFPESTSQGISEMNEQGRKVRLLFSYSFTFHARSHVQSKFSLSLFSYSLALNNKPIDNQSNVNVVAELNGSDIHRLENVMTLSLNLHEMFGNLEIWFEETPTAHRYRIRGIDPMLVEGLPEFVEFTSTDPALPLPEPRYLRLHAACAKVAHLSGAGEYIDTVFRDIEEMPVLANNGASADALSYALLRRGDIAVF
ncbi:hypothetical protein EW146_g9291 [Bondarzewia mesenterica]|uniref:HNH nuclease domain-containing protein n=1 Tax=Bondarzewia mesenterica TaxID=1095465 RepID=A0A4S4LCW0_9AGAM|nr:hypothetical protein EW146_g9291 [Bondarzewia mesenterica]